MVFKNQLTKTTPASVQALYEEYGSMLLGYIFEVVNDMELAESYLVKVFNHVAARFDEISWSDTGTWLQLRRFAKTELDKFNDTIAACDSRAITNSNKYFAQMTDEQKGIFCSIYYHKATAAQLALQLNQPEAYINKKLKEAFTIIKQQHER